MCAQMIIPSTVNLTEVEYLVVKQYADDHCLGDKGFSAAIRMIINEWMQQSSARQVDDAPRANKANYRTRA